MRGLDTRALTLLALFLGAGAGASRADILLDFEQAYYLERDSVLVKDHAVVHHDGLYHVFFIQSLPQEPGEYMRTERWLGHISSPDLRHWTAHDSILHVVPGTWEEKFIWAPKVIEDPLGQGWLLYYAGADEDVCQRIGVAFSMDLFNWSRYQNNPIYEPGRWSKWEEGQWANCRDPEIFRENEQSDLNLFVTAKNVINQGALGRALSEDGFDWEDTGNAFLTNDDTLMIESPQLVRDEGGLYHLFYHEEESDGTYHMFNATLGQGWDMSEASFVNSGRGAELTRLGDEWLYSHFNTVPMVDGPQSFLRFDKIDIDTEDHEPDVISIQGLQDRWQIVFGTAFNYQPTWGDNPYQRGSTQSHLDGNSYIATYEKHPYPGYNVPGWIQGDSPVGLLRSDAFTIEKDRIKLKVGGGAHPDTCFVGLVDAATQRILFSRTGIDSDTMVRRYWNTETIMGVQAYFVIADLYSGEWGSIAVDTIEDYWYDGHEPPQIDDPIVDGPTIYEVLENAGFGGIVDVDAAPLPARGRLLNPYPNPFNPSTRIAFELDRPARLTLSIHDAAGRRLRRLWDGPREAGAGALFWDGRDDAGRPLPSGLYFARLGLDGRSVESRKLVLLK